MIKEGAIYLIPTTLGENAETLDVIPKKVFDIIDTIDEFVVENEKTARRYLKKLNITKPLQEIILHSLNKHTDAFVLSNYLKPISEGKNIGIISEAGCPGIADPGADLVKLAHEKNIRVIPLTGPSSILLSLMASGFNGQNFAFNGYLPKERNERIKKIKELETLVYTKHQTQLFIETPFRNMHLFEDLIAQCRPDTKLCIACDISLPDEFIHTKRISQWKKIPPSLNKRPTVFLLYK